MVAHTEGAAAAATGGGNVLHPRTAQWLTVGVLAATALGVQQLASPSAPRLAHVFWYAWITAVSTGLGAAPWLFVRHVPARWLGLSNALAAGMMVSASAGLLVEAALEPAPLPDDALADEAHPLAPLAGAPAWARAALGVAAGAAFILGTNAWLARHEHLKFGGLAGADARRMLLIVAVMTLHSFSEGVAIGVSFGGPRGPAFGVFIATALAIHNVPEGLATALVLIPRGVSVTQAALWSVLTSLPQPLMALPAFLAVEAFLPFLPLGLGFAAGAMAYVAVFELLAEAWEELGLGTAAGVAAASAAGMGAIQALLKDA